MLQAYYGRVRDLIGRTTAETPGAPTGQFGTILLAATIAAILMSRLYLALATDFPITDGALFVQFIRATAATFPLLPATVEFNGWTLPFGYPPLSFWFGALLTKLGFEPVTIVHQLPILMNVIYVLLVGLLLLKSGWSRLFVALALLFFCTRLAGFVWLLAGGGVSRGMGSIFLIAALLAVTLPRAGQRSQVPHWRMALGGTFVAAAILSHFEWGALAAASVVASRALGARTVKEWIVDSMIAGVTAIILVTPWAVSIVATHGLEPYLNAGSTSSWDFLRSLGIFLGLSLSGVANPFMAVGFVVLLLRREYFWPLFLALCVFVTPRHAPTPLMLVNGVLAAQGVITVWQVGARLFPSRWAAMATAAAVAAIIAVNGYRDYERGHETFRPLRPELRQAMAWVAQNHPGARFAVINSRPWASDSSAEWFPVLTRATNTTTVQGREWLPAPIFQQSEALSDRAKVSKTCGELMDNFGRYGRAEFVWTEMMPECFGGAEYDLVYRNSAVSIYRVAA